jgi:hypothetical protein
MPLWILLIPYALFLFVFGVFSLVDLYHAIRFRSGMISAFFLTVLYLAGTLGILYLSFLLLSPVDWTRTIGGTLSGAAQYGL